MVSDFVLEVCTKYDPQYVRICSLLIYIYGMDDFIIDPRMVTIQVGFGKVRSVP